MIEVKLTEEIVRQLVDEWDEKSVKDFSEELDVDSKTIYRWAKEIREYDSSLCPKKPRKNGSVLKSIVESALSKNN